MKKVLQNTLYAVAFTAFITGLFMFGASDLTSVGYRFVAICFFVAIVSVGLGSLFE